MKRVVLCSLLFTLVLSAVIQERVKVVTDYDVTKGRISHTDELVPHIAVNSEAEVAQHRGRIIGGTEATSHQFPYQVGITSHVITGINGWCGGSLVSTNFVLTAAHCVNDAISLIAILGARSPLVTTEPTQQRMFVSREKIVIHPNWQSSGIVNDIAVFQLPSPLVFSAAVRPIRLPNRRQSQLTFVGQQVTISGWGHFSDSVDVNAQFLRFARAQVITNLACRTRFPLQIADSMVCSDTTTGGTCIGDNGGPMTVQEADGRSTQIGITMARLTNNCENGAPNVFTRITTFLDWIEQNTDVIIAGTWPLN